MKTKKQTMMAWLNNPHFTQEQKVDKIIDDFEIEKQTKRFWQRAYLIGTISVATILICIQAQIIHLQTETTASCGPVNYSDIISETQDSTIAHDCRLIMDCEQVPLEIRKAISGVVEHQLKY